MEHSDELECVIETPFVGRTACLNKLNNVWNKRIFGLYGLRAIGKSRTVKEFLRNKTLKANDDKNNDRLQNFDERKQIIIDMRYIRDSASLHMNLSASLEIEPIHEIDENKYKITWKRQIMETILRMKDTLHLILFDNAEDVIEGPLKDEFLELVTTYLATLDNVKQFITSTTKMMFARMNRAYFAYELGPMPAHEASKLLDTVTQGVNLREYKDAIVRLSEGDVYKKFIRRLTEKHRQRLAILGYIPGTFNAEEARILLNDKTVAVTHSDALVYYRTRSMITQEANTRRFDIQGILRECLDVYNTIKDLPEIRRRYCKAFVKVMKALCRKLGIDEYTKALSQFSQEQPNLQKLLTEVYHSTNETYPFFIKVASDCTELIERFMAREGQIFYEGCLNLAEHFGRTKDMATVHIAIGSMYTYAKGEFTIAGKSYAKALDLLRNEEKTLQLAILYQLFGYNLYARGAYVDSIKYLKESFAIHLNLKTDRTPQALQSILSLGIVNNAMGNFEEAKQYLFKSLRRRELTQGKDHHDVGHTKNYIGVMYGFLGDHDAALKNFCEGFEIKKKSGTATPIWSLVYTMNNIANLYSTMGRFTEAKSLLEEAMQKLNEESCPHKGAIGSTYDSLGKLCLSQEKYRDACDFFEKAVDVRKDISENGLTHVESMMHLAKAQQKIGNLISAETLANKVVSLSEVTNTTMPINTFVSEALEVLVKIYSTKGDKRLKSTLEILHSEMMRQERVYMGSCNTRLVNGIATRLSSIQKSLQYLQ